MKRNYLLLPIIALLFIWTSPAFAIPTLQLDISGGIYDKDTETITATGSAFTLYALLHDGDIKDTYYISAAILPVLDTAADLGSFSFNAKTINATSDMVYGTPPLDATLDGVKDLQSHGVFPTYYTEFSFSFDPANQVGAYNSQDEPGGFADHTGETGMYYAAFNVDVSNLTAGNIIHFDLYNSVAQGKNGEKLAFAPFSHDAQSGAPSPVPEPTTMLLMGSGLLGIVGYSRRKLKTK